MCIRDRNNLSAEEQRVFEQLMEEEPPEDALAFFAQLYDDAPKEQTSETVNIDVYKRQSLTCFSALHATISFFNASISSSSGVTSA